MIHFNKIHLNPINRDIILIVTLGFFIAAVIVSVGVMIASQL
jgi:hypothetical protein